MSRGVKIGIGVIGTIVAVIAIAVVYIYAAGGTGEASAAITAPELAAESSEDESGTATTFDIVPEESLVSFELDEVLRGVPTTVVGITDQIAGQIRVDPANPQAAEVGTIRINLRTLATDNEFRNRAIRGQILLSSQDEYEFSDFVPTAITGLPETVSIGEPFSFQVTGDFSLRGTTNSITFDVTVTPVSETRIEGSATATVNRADFGLEIPDVPSVANVEEEVLLTIEFVAVSA
jgi:polyisoprenoid-binding protein YceI